MSFDSPLTCIPFLPKADEFSNIKYLLSFIIFLDDEELIFKRSPLGSIILTYSLYVPLVLEISPCRDTLWEKYKFRYN